jgi:two-component system, chemotaxis family, chemotaxis protein CheY
MIMKYCRHENVGKFGKMTIDARLAELSVLVVDDSRVSIMMAVQMLTNMKFGTIDSASSAEEAEEKMRARNYDIVFLDRHLSGKSGVALMEQCREDRAYDSVAFVILSGEGGQRFIDGAMKTGATTYIVKPFKPDMLQWHIGKVVEWLEQRGCFKTSQEFP